MLGNNRMLIKKARKRPAGSEPNGNATLTLATAHCHRGASSYVQSFPTAILLLYGCFSPSSPAVRMRWR
jgi:hypothetical protein